MALTKQNLSIPFSTGIDTKTDPLQVMPMSLIDLQNAVFTLDKRLTKRNGFKLVTALPADTLPTTLTTFNNNLTAIGSSLQAFNESTATWVDHGKFQPVQLNVLPLTRSSTSQTAVDTAIYGTLVLSVWADSGGTSKYQVSDSITGQTLLAPISLPSTGNQARVYVLGNNFVVTFLQTVSATPHLRYISIPVNTLVSSSPVDISTQVKSITTGYDAVSIDNTLYIAWNGSDGGGAIRVSFLTSNLEQSGTITVTGHEGDLVSVASDGDVIWVSFYESSSTSLYAFALNPILSVVTPSTLIENTLTLTHITGVVVGGSLNAYVEVANTYGFSPNNDSNYIYEASVDQAGTVGGFGIVVRGVGLASKAFLLNGSTYMLVAYGNTSSFQPTYFLMDGSGSMYARLAYSNGGGYVTTQVLTNVTTTGTLAEMGYLLKDLLAPVSKAQDPNNPANIYAQTGVNLVTFNLAGRNLVTAEIGNNLNIAGGFLWAYDGTLLNEQGFHYWPEDYTVTFHTTGGSIADGTYFHQVTYEWTDAQGNLMRSAPGLPVKTIMAGSGGSGSITLEIPTLRLTYKPGVRIVIYRWSLVQQNYYQVTSITSPLMNNPAVDSVTYLDTASDADILGNLLIYTTGGIVENLPGPATANLGLFKSRLMVVASEDPNVIWYSKQVIQATPVEMSDLFTIYAAPTLSSQGSTGPTMAVSVMDDKFIAFKKNACYYITGTGPDNSGNNNDFSDPIFITSTVGCTNQPSIVLTPMGLVFESDKGQWLLGRGLNTEYIGAPVEKYNPNFVSSSIGIPGTNQVRLCLNNKLVLMYDYYYQRWATFTHIDAISGCIYQGLHTYLDSNGQVLQETPGIYLDNSQPVLMAFTTAWLNLMGLQGFQRAYLLYILGQYVSPHKLSVHISYNYQDGPAQSVLITPSNYAGVWGSVPYWGDGVWGGSGTLEQWRIFLKQQKMQAFQVQVQEQFDPSFGTVPGAGLTISGLNLVVGAKKGFTPLPSSNSAG